MKHLRRLTIVAAVAFSFTACQKDTQSATTARDSSQDDLTEHAKSNHGNNHVEGYVYTLDNQDNNKVIVYLRKHDGTLDYSAAFPTGGKGTGQGLGSEGSVVLTNDNKILLAVNAASNTISSFRVLGSNLYLVSTVNSGGVMPISITEHNNLVYVLNDGGPGNISGFRMDFIGRLYPIHHSTRPLSSNNAGPAQISFVDGGKVLVVTEKNENKIISYVVDHFGIPTAFHSINSANATPYGFAERGFGNIIVSEAAGGAPNASTVSSYQVFPNGNIRLVKGPVAAGQTAACWVVTTDNNKYAYATNTGSNNVSSFSTDFGGRLNVLNATAAASGTTPIDAALSKNSKFLYVLNSGSNGISAYSVSEDGSLNNVQMVNGLPAGTVGLAAK